ncbi:MAG: hypothetical protein DRP71_16070, partial [Verrucomicrobia bacterium]
ILLFENMCPGGMGRINLLKGWRQSKEPHVSFQDDWIEKRHGEPILHIHGEILVKLGKLLLQLEQAEKDAAACGEQNEKHDHDQWEPLHTMGSVRNGSMLE